MPGFDGTGPQGRGPMTGGGFGYCTGYPNTGNPIIARPFGRGFFGGGRRGAGGRGRGRMNMCYATGLPGWMRYTPTQAQATQPQIPQQNKEQEITYLEQQLGYIQKRLQELKGE